MTNIFDNTDNEKGRIRYIGIAKGIAMILVITGHTISKGIVRIPIFSMHMPFFFIMSGYSLAFAGTRFYMPNRNKAAKHFYGSN